MSRLRQINSQNYNTSTQINEEFENIVRYLNAAELGNKTVSELMDILFDEDGAFDASIQLRLDPASGVQYRSGEYTTSEEGWVTVVPIDDIRGTSGIDFGVIGEPVFKNRYDIVAAGGETEIDLPHDASSLFMVFKNGLLLLEGATADYVTSTTGGTGGDGSITFTAALVLDDKVAIFKIYNGVDFDVTRTDETVAVSPKSNFGFVHEPDDAVQVYKNGILQEVGVTADYYLDTDNDLVIFNTPVPVDDVVTIISVSSVDTRTVAGLMTESNYTNLGGLILYSKLLIQDGEIPQSKVQDLVAALAATPDITVGASTPDPVTRFWLDTSSNPNQLKFYDGSKYLSANPASALPSFDETNAAQILAVDPTGSTLEFGDIDFSSLIPKTQKASANGVASLDSAARLPVGQLPEFILYDSLNYYEAGSVADGSKRFKRIYKQDIEIHAIDFRTDSGTCNIQIEIDGVTAGSIHAVSVASTPVTLSSPIAVDASLASKLIGLSVTNAVTGSATNLDVALVVKVKSQ